ncbi:Oidioi.mRNA.OKI2018_I69.chr2.g4245.t1.cds [Oikopleura dioica]|uniref:Oidioi.mRNA.OKI2018_I69.chr2.g4245.t1.cds n=1 Tax=Oikopleura dioica TaxID=34765 RepID=A0ABN7T0Z5_OIKDI|nr:Oidioi.mRNA.OKI2018_I69.chr2.g4245.t1.cds [Oikopleura dioica]
MRVFYLLLSCSLSFSIDNCPEADLYEECEAKCRLDYNKCRLLCETDFCLSLCVQSKDECMKSCPCGEYCPFGCYGCQNEICPRTTSAQISTTIITTTTALETTREARVWFERTEEDPALTMEGAENFCQDRGGHLLFFRTQEEYELYLAEFPVRLEHFGYRQVTWKSASDYFYRNTDGSNATFHQFGPGHPSTYAAPCIYNYWYLSTGDWAADYCYTSRQFTCRFEENFDSGVGPTIRPKNVTFIQQEEKSTMELAEYKCNQQGGHLAFFENEEEWKEFTRLPMRYVEYIGVREGSNRVQYSTVTGNRDPFLKWYGKEPNDGRDPCVIINYGAPGYFADAKCYGQYFYSCRFEN